MKNFNFKLSILFLITIIISFTLTTAAYFKTDDYRPILLEVRRAERAIREAENRLEQAEKNFILIDKELTADIQAELEENYQLMIKAYQQKNDTDLRKFKDKVVAQADQLALSAVESKEVQLRAFWLDSRTLAQAANREGVQELLDLAAMANFNVIFPEIYFKGQSIVPDNKLIEQDERFKDWDEDPLKVLIEEAQLRELEVHGWVWVFNENTVGEAGPILQKNPEWANKNKAGAFITYHNTSWLSPAREDVKQYLQQRYLYLVEHYDLDGINLDYIRYPDEFHGSFGYDQKNVELFIRETGINPFAIEDDSEAESKWNRFRENLITEMVKETAQLLREKDPDLKLSADVLPGLEEARYRSMQNWGLWLEKGYLDFVLPMTYTENMFSELERWIKNDRKRLTEPIYPGIAVFMLTERQLLRQIEEINSLNPNGLSLFAAAHLKENDFEILAQGLFRNRALLAGNDKNKALKIIYNNIITRLEMMEETALLKEADKKVIENYLNESLEFKNNDNNKTNLSYFLDENSIELNAQIRDILINDFNYLNDILTLY